MFAALKCFTCHKRGRKCKDDFIDDGNAFIYSLKAISWLFFYLKASFLLQNFNLIRFFKILFITFFNLFRLIYCKFYVCFNYFDININNTFYVRLTFQKLIKRFEVHKFKNN